ncbi:hypothetical protein FMN50_08805 [Rhodobacterales bacterium]|nr:hypothetical protein FMN50_08805 [Rhodobacterales bacterium]
MTIHDPKLVATLLASGLYSLRTRKDPVARIRQDEMPKELREGLVRLSAICLEEGLPDKGSSIHEFMEMATQPIRSWGLSAFNHPFPYADMILVDGSAGVPTEECRDLAEEGGFSNIAEGLHFDRFKQAISAVPRRRQPTAYTSIREFIVRNPVVSVKDINRFVSDPTLIGIARDIESFFERIPVGAIRSDGTLKTCSGCGTILWPDSDLKTNPNGRCRLSHCNEASGATAGKTISDPDLHRVVKRDILAYWVGPGLDEIRIYDSLTASGIEVSLYPSLDAADIGAKDLSFGIDAKSYSCPAMLGRKLSSGVGGLVKFTERYVSIPDAKLRFNPNYLKELRSSYSGKVPVNFMTVSDTITTIRSKYGLPATKGADVQE